MVARIGMNREQDELVVKNIGISHYLESVNFFRGCVAIEELRNKKTVKVPEAQRRV
jgi:hypothetical protein